MMTLFLLLVVASIIFLIVGIGKYNKFYCLLNELSELKSNIGIQTSEYNNYLGTLSALLRKYGVSPKELYNMPTQNIYNRISELTIEFPSITNEDNVQSLMNKLDENYKQLTASRKKLSAKIREYNNTIGMFPNNMFALLMGFKREDEINKDNLGRATKLMNSTEGSVTLDI